MPTWLFIILIILGCLSYLALWFVIGDHVVDVMNEKCQGRGIDNCTHWDHSGWGFAMFLWPIGYPIFAIWYIKKFVPSLHLGS